MAALGFRVDFRGFGLRVLLKAVLGVRVCSGVYGLGLFLGV